MLKTLLEKYRSSSFIAQFATHEEILPKLDSIYMNKSDVFDKKWRRWHFCDAPRNFENFDMIF